MDYFLNGTLDNYIDRLCAAMEYVDKEWVEKVLPATTEQIAQLCNLAGISGKCHWNLQRVDGFCHEAIGTLFSAAVLVQ